MKPSFRSSVKQTTLLLLTNQAVVDPCDDKKYVSFIYTTGLPLSMRFFILHITYLCCLISNFPTNSLGLFQLFPFKTNFFQYKTNTFLLPWNPFFLLLKEDLNDPAYRIHKLFVKIRQGRLFTFPELIPHIRCGKWSTEMIQTRFGLIHIA